MLDERLWALESKALRPIQRVDLDTPLRQLHDVLAALIDVPTRERRTDTEFALQAAVASDTFVVHTHRLGAFGHALTEHVHGSRAAAHPQSPENGV